MKKVQLFHMYGCPYCQRGFEVLEELYAEHPEYKSIEIELIEETEHADIADQYDYYYVPSVFVDGQKVYEANRSESREEVKEKLQQMLELAQQ